MTSKEKLRKSSEEKMNELLTKYEEVRIKAREHAQERKEEIEQHIKALEAAKNDLEDKWKRVQNFGEETAEELSDAFTLSATAFSDFVNKTENKLSN